MKRLLEAGTRIFDVSHIFFSHLHPDHTSELVPFLFANKYPDPTLRKNRVTVIAGEGFADFFSGLERVYGEWIQLDPALMKIIELRCSGRDAARFNDFSLESMPVAHTDTSLAFRVTSPGGKSVVYSGDTDVCEELVELARDADVLVCECATPDDQKAPGHLTPALAGEMAAQAKVRTLVLTHFYPACDAVDIAAECRKTYQGRLLLAEDLMEIAVD
jgi:ribonuclease BN (tRNA processing enzyme)